MSSKKWADDIYTPEKNFLKYSKIPPQSRQLSNKNSSKSVHSLKKLRYQMYSYWTTDHKTSIKQCIWNYAINYYTNMAATYLAYSQASFWKQKANLIRRIIVAYGEMYALLTPTWKGVIYLCKNQCLRKLQVKARVIIVIQLIS